MEFIKKDNYIFGALMGVLLPLFLFGLIRVINYFIILTGLSPELLDLKMHVLISFAGNLLPIRYYFVSLKYDKTGRGILLVTFILFIAFFALKDKFL